MYVSVKQISSLRCDQIPSDDAAVEVVVVAVLVSFAIVVSAFV